MPNYAKLSIAECNAVHIAREYAPDAARKAMKREIFSRAKVGFGIPATHKMIVETDVQNPNAGVLKNKATREAYLLNDDTGRWVGAANGTNATDTQVWFKLPVEDLRDAIGNELDNLDANGDTIARLATKPNGRFAHPHHEDIVFGEDGSLWVKLDADAYDEHEGDEHGDDPY